MTNDLNAVITVSRNKLRKALEERMEIIRKEHADNHWMKELQNAIDRYEEASTETSEGYTERLIQWHKSVAEGLEKGEITLTQTGRLRNEPKKPKRGQPTGGSYYSRWSKNDLLRQLAQHEKQLEVALAPVQAALTMLDMTTTASVQIDASEYQKLLSGGR
jgi:hypothetical protein